MSKTRTSERDILVIIPSWSPERTASLIWELVRRESRQRAAYLVVGCQAPLTLHEDLAARSQWIEPEHALAPVEAMSLGWQMAGSAGETSGIGIVAFLHDDMLIEASCKGWDAQIADHFEAHPRCGLLGFGGGIGFATDDIYKTPYRYQQLARQDFVSNMREAEAHGRRVTEPMQVAALDGFSLVCSREFYETAGIGPLDKDAWAACLADGIQFHMYDAWLSCRAAELRYEVWMLPVECHHQGGQTSVQQQERYAQVTARLGYATPEELYVKAHERVYERFQRVLPIRVPYRS